MVYSVYEYCITHCPMRIVYFYIYEFFEVGSASNFRCTVVTDSLLLFNIQIIIIIITTTIPEACRRFSR